MLKKLIRYIKGYEKAAILAPLFVIVEVICELILPTLMADIIDIGIEGGGGISYIIKIGAIMIVLCLFAIVAGVSSARFASVGSQGFGANLRKAMFDKAQDFSFADIDRFSSASLITRMTNDVNNIQMMVNMGLRMLVAEVDAEIPHIQHGHLARILFPEKVYGGNLDHLSGILIHGSQPPFPFGSVSIAQMRQLSGWRPSPWETRCKA